MVCIVGVVQWLRLVQIQLSIPAILQELVQSHLGISSLPHLAFQVHLHPPYPEIIVMPHNMVVRIIHHVILTGTSLNVLVII